jgi:adenosylcobinamide kinase / adenosylcobinamide-phosphate guanylyltransferase
MSLRLVTGGVRSGKSRFAESLARSLGGRVLVLATGTPGDEEMKRRIEEHRRRRPSGWNVLEEPLRLAERLREFPPHDVILVDGLSTWVANRLLSSEEKALRHPDVFEAEIVEETRKFLDCLGDHRHGILVTDETGLGGVAVSPLGRRFQDVLGLVNQEAARRADEVWFVVSGIPWRIRG